MFSLKCLPNGVILVTRQRMSKYKTNNELYSTTLPNKLNVCKLSRQITYNRMLAQLAQCEFAVVKSEYSSKMMKQEKKNYEIVSSKIDLAIEQTKKQIVESKEKLVLAKKIRKNRMEYDVLAKIISQQPDRRKTTEKLELLKKDLNELGSIRQQLETKMEIRKNEFSVLMRSIKELQNKLDDYTDEDGDVVVKDVEMMDVAA